MSQKTVNKNPEMVDAETFFGSMVESLLNTIGDDYECKLSNETVLDYNIGYVLNIEHIKSGEHNEVPINDLYEKVSTWKMTKEEAFMYFVISALSDIEHNRKAEALYKSALKKYDRLKTNNEDDMSFSEQSDRRYLRGKIGRGNFDNTDIDRDVNNLHYELDDEDCIKDGIADMYFDKAKSIGEFQGFSDVYGADDENNDFDECTMNNMSNEECESYDFVDDIRYNMVEQLGDGYVCRIKFVKDISDFEQENGSDFKTRIFAIEVSKDDKVVKVIDAEKLYEDIVYDDMPLPEAASLLVEEVHQAE